MSEREHAATVARDVCVYLSAERDGDEFRFLADLIERERAAAWLEGRNAGLDAAKLPFDDILKRAVAEARRQALEEAARETEVYAARRPHWTGLMVDSAIHLARAIRALVRP